MPGKILIADDQSSTRFLLKNLVEKEFYTVLEATNGQEVIDIAQSERIDLILLDIEMPILDGIEACKRLKANPQTLHIPVIMVTAYDSQAGRNKGLYAGADDYLARPIDPQILSVRIRNLIRVKQLTDELDLRIKTLNRNFNIYVDNVPEIPDSALVIAANICHSLGGHFRAEHVPCETEALKAMETAQAIILSEELPCGGSGLRLIAHIRAVWEYRHKVIIFIAKSNDKAGLRALDFGANDYLISGFDLNELIIRLNTQLKRKYYTDKLRDIMDESIRSSVIDPLTGLHNRRYFDAYMPSLIEKAEKTGSPIAFMMLDLDHFKNLNDTYGHDAGDLVLAETAERLRTCLRASDLIVRWGGEEFIAIVPNLAHNMIEILAERLRLAIEETPYTLPNGENVRMTTSIGVTFAKKTMLDVTNALNQADIALYKAKNAGRNRIIFANL